MAQKVYGIKLEQAAAYELNADSIAELTDEEKRKLIEECRTHSTTTNLFILVVKFKLSVNKPIVVFRVYHICIKQIEEIIKRIHLVIIQTAFFDEFAFFFIS